MNYEGLLVGLGKLMATFQLSSLYATFPYRLPAKLELNPTIIEHSWFHTEHSCLNQLLGVLIKI